VLRHHRGDLAQAGHRDARLVTDYLGHADLSTVSRYAHVASDELHEATATLGHRLEPSASRDEQRDDLHQRRHMPTGTIDIPIRDVLHPPPYGGPVVRRD